MPLSITGYVLEPPRVGSSNSPFTQTPSNFLSDSSAFNTAYPSNESVPRTEYLVQVLNDFEAPGTGPGLNGSFADATFVWTKNEVIARFDYFSQDGRFKSLPGSVLEQVGILAADANTNRLKVSPPTSSDFSTFPVRISIGSGSGTTLTSVSVLNDGSFSVPTAGTVQISRDTGNLNWAPADITTYLGQTIRFQQQQFYPFSKSSGNLGVINDALLLNPLPAPGQFPLVRIGFGEYLNPVERANEGAFLLDPTAGTVEWALTTGRIKFNSSTVTANQGRNIYYDGTAFSFGSRIQVSTLGTIATPGVMSPAPSESSDLFFRIAAVVQFAQTVWVDTLTSPGKKGTVQVRRSDGQVRFSNADQALYTGQTIQACIPDIVIERGMSIRMFRTPVNPADTDPAIRDVKAFYASTKAVLASPIIGASQVSLPAIPVDTRTLTLEVTQGTGTFVGSLPRMDVPGPPTGLGYIIDFEARNLLYVQRKSSVVIPAPTPYGGVQLPDPLVRSPGLVLEVENSPGSNTYTPLVLGQDALIDLESGLVTNVSTAGTLKSEGLQGVLVGQTFTDSTRNFTTLGVVPGDYLEVLAGSAKGLYVISAVGTTTVTTDVPGPTASNISYQIKHGTEILADRFFYEVPPLDPHTKVERLKSLGAISNSPRRTIDAQASAISRFRFGSTTFSTVTSTVANDGAFTSPASLPQGTVEISLSTGNLNFSQVNVSLAGVVFWAKTLTLGVDYSVQSSLGFVQLSERMLTDDEVFVQYRDAERVLQQERVSFLIRKELVQPHPVPTSTLYFNTAGHEVASQPTPKVYRGGRHQASGQVNFNIPASTVTFVGALTVTDALPSGPIIGPTENVYLDYSIYGALGGENNFTVLKPPMQGVSISITEGEGQFQIAGDRTSVFAPQVLLLVDRSEAYLIGSSSYNVTTEITTIVLTTPQTFRSDLTNPTLAVSSGLVRLAGSPAAPSYFLTEMAAYESIPRGAGKFKIVGDLSRVYLAGTIVLFDVLDLNVVSGSKYDPETNRTEITLLSNGIKQYIGSSLKRSVRPCLPSPSASVITHSSPELGQPYAVWRKVENQVGQILTSPDQYKIDGSGIVTLAGPLNLNEAVGIFYTGDTIIEAGRRFRASYTFSIVPNVANGLLSQKLNMTYTTYSPDTFFWRVETFTNFRGELADQYSKDAKATVPTGGPILENSSSPKLFEQGKKSLFFEEGYLANEDLVARPTLKYYNDSINYLENALQGMDGRVVGDHDGKFLFDGNIDNPTRTTFASVTNQIDDRFKVSPAPFVVTGPPFVATSIGTFVEVYKASPTSRFYPTQKTRFGVVVAGTLTGDPIMDTGLQNLRSGTGIRRRYPWAVVTRQAGAGMTVLQVDDADGSDVLIRPPFVSGMKVAIQDQNGTVLVADSPGLTISGTSATTITLGAVPVTIPVGATVRLSTIDTSYNKQYRLDVDLGVNLEKGLLTYLDPVGSSWSALTPPPASPAAGEALDLTVLITNSSTDPERFPALDGGTQDDDGNRQFPILTPSQVSETSGSGYLTIELSIIQTGPGLLRAATQVPFLGTGSLDGTATIITNTGAWPSPIPKLYDVVEIRSGLNAGQNFRRVVAVGGSTLTVDSSYGSVDSGFSFSVSTTASLVTGTGGAGTTVNSITDLAANFSTVQPGMTVVATSGANQGLRRQVTTVVSNTIVQFGAFPGTMLGSTYRIDNPLQTFGGTAGSVRTTLSLALLGEQTTLTNNVLAIDNFFSTALTNIVTGVNGVANTATFSAASQTFVTSGVTTAHLIFLRSGPDAGFYKIQSVDSETSITIDGTFPSNLAGLTFRIVKSVGLTKDPLNGVLGSALSSETFLTGTGAFYSIESTSVPVTGDAGAAAYRLITSDLDTRETAVNARFTQVPLDVVAIESELSAGDRLYDKRFVWIDARINLRNGILVSKERAVQNRIKAQADTLKQLTKLLSVSQT